jgi:hypothetical protein
MDTSLIILPSALMDGNKKQERSEDTLVRMSKATRDTLTSDNILLSGVAEKKQLEVFKAFTKDMIRVRQFVLEGTINHEDVTRIGFVSSNTFKKLGGQGHFLDLSKIPKEKPKEKPEIVIDKFLIGTDPELLLIKDGNIVNASSIEGFNKYAKFGSDGAAAELRPNPAFTAEDLVKNIKEILQDKTVNAKLHGIDLISACYYEDKIRDYPVGTHIHIDNPKQIAALPVAERYKLFAVTNKILDELLTVPMIRLDGTLGHNRRAKCKMSMANGYNGGNYGKGYGYFGEWRECNGRLEHRSLSGLVMANPEIATAVFGTAQAIAEASYGVALKNNLDTAFILPDNFKRETLFNKTFKGWGKIPIAEILQCTASSKEISDLMDASDRSVISQEYIKQWLVKIRKLPTYAKFSNYIEALGEILSASDKALDSLETKIKTTWKD